MTALKDAENNAIYTIEIGSETQTSKYPLLVSNPEKNPDVQSKTAWNKQNLMEKTKKF